MQWSAEMPGNDKIIDLWRKISIKIPMLFW